MAAGPHDRLGAHVRARAPPPAHGDPRRRATWRRTAPRSRTATAPPRSATRCCARREQGARETVDVPLMAPTVLLIGTLDTKGEEYAYLRERLRSSPASTCSWPTPAPAARRAGVEPDITREEVAAETGADLASLTDRGAAVGAMAERGRGARAPAARRGPDRRRARRGRLGQHRDRHGGDAGAAGRRAQADGLDRWRPATRATTSAASDVDADGVGHRRRRDQLDLRADPRQRGGRDGRAWCRRRAVERRGRAPAGRRDDVRRHDPVRDARARGARGARLRGARLPRHRHRRPGDGGARRGRLPAPACSTRRRRSCATTSSAACCRPGPTGSRRRAAPGCRRSSRSARSTWSTSARATRCRRSSRSATCTSTTRRSR